MEQLTELFEVLERNITLSSAGAAMTSAAAAILALIVSVAAVVVAITSSRQQRTHNILTVKPIPEITLANYENLLRVKLRNHGSGPLLIEKLTANFLDKQYDSLIECMPKNKDIQWANFAGKVNDRALLPGGEIVLIELKQNPNDTNFNISRDLVRHALSYSDVIIKYTDIYNTKFPIYKKTLEWFQQT
ncbi:hypothetical protein [Pseudomonas sp. ABFPK]|uniref:hypothetical protein n=1 Tax=Pseudomonas sp. ABFPK TaxID=1636605 RepID=UPI000AD61CF3|nr:hypothetical protein [Pseudomonas sp. ABFPK]